jgi:hypothetical protein
MVALEPLLHRWWGKALIGFEPIEKIEKGIRVRYRWLPKTTLAMKDKVAFDLSPLDCLQPYSDQDGYIAMSHPKTHRPIVDGTIIDITAQDESAIPSWDIFSLQWDLIRMASLCGAAEASDDDWESDDDDEAPWAKAAKTTDDLHLDSPTPITLSATPSDWTPLQSLPVQSLEWIFAIKIFKATSITTGAVSRIFAIKVTPIATSAVSRIFASKFTEGKGG